MMKKKNLFTSKTLSSQASEEKTHEISPAPKFLSSKSKAENKFATTPVKKDILGGISQSTSSSVNTTHSASSTVASISRVTEGIRGKFFLHCINKMYGDTLIFICRSAPNLQTNTID